MRTLLLNLLLVLCSFSVFGIKGVPKGKQRYVWAESGLNLRTAPNVNAEKVNNIPFGAHVTLVEDAEMHPFTYKMAASKTAECRINGHWVKVAYNGQTGYVFDGYLSKFPTITESPQQHPGFQLDLLREYGKKHWGGLDKAEETSTINYASYSIDPDKGRSSFYKLTFQNGSYYETIEESFSGTQRIFIKDVSLAEAFLFFNSVTGFEAQLKKEKKAAYLMRLSSATEEQLDFKDEHSMSTINIKVVKGGVLIQTFGGC